MTYKHTIVSGETLTNKDNILGGLFIMQDTYSYKIVVIGFNEEAIENVTKVFLNKGNTLKLARLHDCKIAEEDKVYDIMIYRTFNVSCMQPIFFNVFPTGMVLYEEKKKELDSSYVPWTKEDFKAHNFTNIIDLAKNNKVRIEVYPLHDNTVPVLDIFLVDPKGRVGDIALYEA